jgi:hypothetical protein
MKKIFLIFILFLLVAPIVTMAKECPYDSKNPPFVKCGYQDSCPCEFQDLLNILPSAINFILYTLVIPLSVIFLIIGGVMIMISAGDPGRAQIGKQILLATIIGMVLAFGAWLIVNFILTTLLGVKDIYLQPFK